MKKFFFTIAVITTIAAVVVGCSSRYRLDLYMTTADETKKVKVESTEYVREAVLANPFSEQKLMTGLGNCLILNVAMRGERLKVDKTNILGYDEYFRCRVYVQLPSEPAPGSFDLKDNSFVHILGRFELPAESKLFTSESGQVVVDSLTRKYLFGSIKGDYRNRSSDPLSFDGRFKVKIKK